MTANKIFSKGCQPSITSVQLVLFLSRLFSLAEKNYWPMELEIAGFVWVVKKMRYIIKLSKVKIIIQTNYSIIINILQQSLITSTTSTMRLNLRPTRVSQFLQQFKLDIRHKLGKKQIIPNALSCLTSANSLPTDARHSELDALFVYNITQIEIYPTLVS